MDRRHFNLGSVFSPKRMKPSPIGELTLIDRIRNQFAAPRSRNLALGIGDDCAILRPPPGSEIVVTTDFSLEGRHFRRDWHSPESVGHRCLARGLSDLAAMGAAPLAAFLSLALPTDLKPSWVNRFLIGLHALATRYRVPLAGGDTAQSPTGLILADIVLLGTTPTGQALRRSGARPCDLLYVTGSLGGSAAELTRLSDGRSRKLRSGTAGSHPQLFPEPRLTPGKLLLKRQLATACMDLSDGLSTDLSHLCRASNLGAEIEQAHLPLHPSATVAQALHGGEDYELLFTAPATTRMPRRLANIPITRIGTMTPAKRGITLLQPDGTSAPLQPGGWEHFRS